MSNRVLILEDDTDVGPLLVDYFQRRVREVTHFTKVADAEAALKEGTFDAFISDGNLSEQ